MARFLAIFATFALIGASVAETRVEIVLSAKGLPKTDVCCLPGYLWPDPYAIVYLAESDFGAYRKIGETSTIQDEPNPEWTERFEFKVADGARARIKIEIMDQDVEANDYIGYQEVDVSEIIAAADFDNLVEKTLRPDGNGRIFVAGRIDGVTKQKALFAQSHVPVQVTFAEKQYMHSKRTWMNAQ